MAERYAWRALVKEGKMAEYIKRHNEIGEDMKSELKKAGICNYSIWADGNDLFGYYECEKGVKFAAAFQKNSEVVKKWEEKMKDILIMVLDPETGAQPLLKEVFRLE